MLRGIGYLILALVLSSCQLEDECDRFCMMAVEWTKACKVPELSLSTCRSWMVAHQKSGLACWDASMRWKVGPEMPGCTNRPPIPGGW